MLLGMTDEQFSLSAKGGDTDGDGGKINLYGWTSSIEVHDAGAVSTPLNVSAPGGAGDGGTINIVAYGSAGLIFDGTASYLKADSGTNSGNGGTIQIQASYVPIVIGTGSNGNVDISAISKGGDGNGGKVDILDYSGLTVNSANISVNADGDGTGGKQILRAGYSTLTLNGNLNSDGGAGDGAGGLVEIEGGYIALPSGVNTTLHANGNGTGKGGRVSITSHYQSVDIDGANQKLTIEARGTNSGNGGEAYIYADNSVSISGAALDVSAGSSASAGVGGDITVISHVDEITVSGTLNSSGVGNGKGGNIILQAGAELTLQTATVNANGNGSGNGGSIALQAGTDGNALVVVNSSSSINASSGAGGATGGSVIIVYNSLSGDDIQEIEGSVRADALSGLNGVIAVTNSSAAILRVESALISAVNGSINFNQSGQEVHVRGLTPAADGPFFGTVNALGTVVSIKTEGTADLVLEDVKATVGTIGIETDEGDVISVDDSKVEAAGLILLTSTTGKMGKGSTPLILKSSSVGFQLGTTSGTAINIQCLESVIVYDCTCYGDIIIFSDSDLQLADGASAANGSVFLEADGTFLLPSNKGIYATEGSISISSDGILTLGANSAVVAATATSNPLFGNVAITNLGLPSFQNQAPPTNVVIAAGAPDCFFGVNNITANSPDNQLTALGRFIAFDTNGLPDYFIVLDGNVQVSSAGA